MTPQTLIAIAALVGLAMNAIALIKVVMKIGEWLGESKTAQAALHSNQQTFKQELAKHIDKDDLNYLHLMDGQTKNREAMAASYEKLTADITSVKLTIARMAGRILPIGGTDDDR